MINLLKLERIYTKPFDLNGYRILVDRLWARGGSKSNAKLDQWAKTIAPSNQLRKWFSHQNPKFAEFQKRYFQELDQNPVTRQFVKSVQRHLKLGTVILLYGAKNARHNNAVVLRTYLNRKLNLNLKPRNDLVNFLYNDGETNRSKKLTRPIQWFRQHPAALKHLRLRIGRNQHLYQPNEIKALSHQALLTLAIKHR